MNAGNKGSTLNLILDFTFDDEPLYEDQFVEMELQLNEESGCKKSVKLLLSEGGIRWSEDEGKYVAYLTQEDTIDLPDIIAYQLRAMEEDSNEVYTWPIGHFSMDGILSKKILGVKNNG